MAVVNVKSEIAGNVWKITSKPGDRIEAEGEIMILESMKMEIPVLSPKAGTIKEIKVNRDYKACKACKVFKEHKGCKVCKVCKDHFLLLVQ